MDEYTAKQLYRTLGVIRRLAEGEVIPVYSLTMSLIMVGFNFGLTYPDLVADRVIIQTLSLSELNTILNGLDIWGRD